jgi:hypothetical protein
LLFNNHSAKSIDCRNPDANSRHSFFEFAVHVCPIQLEYCQASDAYRRA